MEKNKLILGAIAGDIIGSVFEWKNVKTTDFDLFTDQTDFTDDTVLTVATMECLTDNSDYSKTYQSYCRRFPNRGYGERFRSWISSNNPAPYNSWGNGSAMRVSPAGWAFDTLEEVLFQGKRSAEVTHNHPEGIKGAQAVASSVLLARKGGSKSDIKSYVKNTFGYNLNRTIDEIRPTFEFDESCQGTVPEAIIAFLESTDFENAIRLAISLGGDSDTIACITGGIAEAFYGEIPDYIVEGSLNILPDGITDTVREFSLKFKI
jgi:ADP-ribosylglycohydrolase